MAGKLAPLVVWPRFTTFSGGNMTEGFTTLPLDVSDYSQAVVTIWRGPTTVGFSMTCEESVDKVNWVVCAGTNTNAYDPGTDTEGIITATLKRQWFRARVANTGDENLVTCWAVGHLVRRER